MFRQFALYNFAKNDSLTGGFRADGNANAMTLTKTSSGQLWEPTQGLEVVICVSQICQRDQGDLVGILNLHLSLRGGGRTGIFTEICLVLLLSS